MKIAVYTAIIDDYDELIADQNYEGADWFIFSDQPINHKNWHYLKAIDIFKDPRITARYHKFLPHFYFQDYDYNIWLDATVKLKVPAPILVALATKFDILSLKHPLRNCAYAEINQCLKDKLDYPYRLMKIREKMLSDDYPLANGLAETKVVVRKNNKKVVQFNEQWFLTMMEASLRDQTMFNYLAWKLKVKLGMLPPINELEKMFEKMPHKKKQRQYF